MGPHGWAPHVEMLKQRWVVEGLRAVDIAKLFSEEVGRVITRNAVLGAIDRLGLGDLRPRPRKSHKCGAARQAAKSGFMPFFGKGRSVAQNQALDRAKAPGPLVATLERMAAADRLVPICERVSLVDLEHHQCKWPIGDPAEEGFGYCGKNRKAGASRPYCEGHLTMSYGAGTVSERRATIRPPESGPIRLPGDDR